ncbi:MAG TPA: EAL domain-containing protein [Conexibacter sp.]|nr:EAL domain-containing protein [Conexibacter sp.]
MFSRVSLRPGFLLSFAVLLAVGVGGLAYAVSAINSNDIRDAQIAAARERGELLAQAAYAPALRNRLAGFDAADLRPLDRAALAAKESGDLTSLAVWDRRGRVVYATDHGQIDRTYRKPAAVEEALKGDTVVTTPSSPTSPLDRTEGEQIQIVAPLYGRDRRTPHAAMEMHVPYAPVQAEISRRTNRINLILVCGALLFLAGMWPRLLSASRALREREDPRRRKVLSELKEAIEQQQLELHYQPKIDLRSGEIAAVESLVRWNHPRDGLLGPDRFLPHAAGSELIGPLTVHLIELALRDCAGWRGHGVEAGVDVNLDVGNVLDPQLPKEVERLLAKWELPARALGFELTEAAIQADPDKAAGVLRDLAAQGVRLAIDDFGTGFSSLAVLREMPLDEIKIDRSFVAGLTRNAADESIVRSTIGLAHDLDLGTVAEGVEDEATLRRLAELGCDQAQGWYFSRPLPLDALLAWFAQPAIGVEPPPEPARA